MTGGRKDGRWPSVESLSPCHFKPCLFYDIWLQYLNVVLRASQKVCCDCVVEVEYCTTKMLEGNSVDCLLRPPVESLGLAFPGSCQTESWLFPAMEIPPPSGQHISMPNGSHGEEYIYMYNFFFLICMEFALKQPGSLHNIWCVLCHCDWRAILQTT